MNIQFTIDKRMMLYIVLCSIFLSNALMAELIGVKIFSLEDSLSFERAQINILGFKLDFNLTAGVIIWPVVFIVSDIINEYYGVNGVKKISYISAVIIGYTFFVIFIATQLPPADFWLQVNNIDNQGNFFNIDFAYRKLFGQGMGIIIGSITAFLVGQIVDAYTFQYLKKITNSKKLWIRATGSTLFSQLIDSFLVLYIAFFIFGNWEMEQVLAVGFVNYIYKFCVAIFLTPLLYAAHFVIDNYLAEKK